jgi:hypothetical protein
MRYSSMKRSEFLDSDPHTFHMSHLAGLQMGLYAELATTPLDAFISVSLPPAGDDRSNLNGDSRMAESGEPDGEEEEGAVVIRAGGGDLDLACLSRRDFSCPAPPLDCCCLACCRHLARRFLNHTCTSILQMVSDFSKQENLTKNYLTVNFCKARYSHQYDIE